jgi:hypothetical protein
MFTDRGGENMRGKAQQARTGIPLVASLIIRPDRLEQMWAMTPTERRRAAETGQLSLGEMLRWAARRPHEVELVDGEFFFITALWADAEETSGDAQAFWNGEYTPLPQACDASNAPTAERDTSGAER